mgnify:CR=1 FL=1
MAHVVPRRSCRDARGKERPNEDPRGVLEARKRALEADLRERYPTAESLTSSPRIRAYSAYFSRHGKTYPVLLQVQSLALKGKLLPAVSPLVDTMFMAELKNLLLTAGHDLDTIIPPVVLDVSRGGETYVRLNGQEQVLKPGDMFMRDQGGVLSSVLYGPDFRSRITPSTRNVLFVVYAPPGIGAEAVREHLEEIARGVKQLAPRAGAERPLLYQASERCEM